MEHTLIVRQDDLEEYAKTKASEGVIPELANLLVHYTAVDLLDCRIPFGDNIGVPGWDGLVRAGVGFEPFVPKGSSYWEIGTGDPAIDKATKEFRKRTEQMGGNPEMAQAAFVFFTPCAWTEPSQRSWLTERGDKGWGRLKIIDSVVLADWLRHRPFLAKWLLKKMGLTRTTVGFATPAEHWENLGALQNGTDPPLPPQLFLAGRELATKAVERIFREGGQLVLAVEGSTLDVQDFLAAFLATQNSDQPSSLASRCLFIEEKEVWASMSELKAPHVLVGHQSLDLDGVGGEQLLLATKRTAHAVIIPASSGAFAAGEDVITLREPSSAQIAGALEAAGYSHERARELGAIGAHSLARLKRHLKGLGAAPPYTTWNSAPTLALASMLGRWHGENEADQAAIAEFLGKPYGGWIEMLRPEILRPEAPLTQNLEHWKVLARGESWTALGPLIGNADLDRFKGLALDVLGENDPLFEQHPDERIAMSFGGKRLKYSNYLRKGVVESLALIGSRSDALTQVSPGKAEAVAGKVVHDLLHNADWKRWASLNHFLPLLAEAAPEQFLESVSAALSNDQKPLQQVFGQERPDFFTGGNHTTGLLWALEILAWSPTYFHTACELLGELAAIDPGGTWANRPSNSLTSILLPWHPQTIATMAMRKLAVSTVATEQPLVGWKLLLDLLPTSHGSTSGTHKPSWRKFIPPDWSPSVQMATYVEEVTAHADVAFQMALRDLSKLIELVERLPDLPQEVQETILLHLGSDAALRMSEAERLPLWEAILDLAATHRKYAGAHWAMSGSTIAALESIANQMQPHEAVLKHRRLFSDRDHNLLEGDGRGDFRAQQKKLDALRQMVVGDILRDQGLESVLAMAKDVAAPEKLGYSLGFVADSAIDAVLLPQQLDAVEQRDRTFISSYVWGRFHSQGWHWVDGLNAQLWSTRQKAQFLVWVPFRKETWQKAEVMLGGDVSAFWELATAGPFVDQDIAAEAAEHLLKFGRPWAALECLKSLIYHEVGVDTDLALRSLLDGLRGATKPNRSEVEAALKVIEWLQDAENVDATRLGQVEWGFIEALDGSYHGSPKTLEKQLSTDPKFFSEMIAIVYRPEKVEVDPAIVTDMKIRNAQNGFRLLHNWQKPPGLQSDGTFDAGAFEQWLSGVRDLTKASGHFEVALNKIGESLAFVPADPEDLWINRTVARALNAKDAESMRSGFTRQIFNNYGRLHAVTGGIREQRLADEQNSRADALEAAGFSRFARAMRGLAKNYEQEAKIEAARQVIEE